MKRFKSYSLNKNLHTDTQTDTTENITYPHTRVVTIVFFALNCNVNIILLENKTDGVCAEHEPLGNDTGIDYF